jgi:hypothetical protein
MGLPVITHPFPLIHEAKEGIDAIGYGSTSGGVWHRDIHGIGYFLFGQSI